MKKIGIDLSLLSRGKLTGWERSTENLYKLLKDSENKEFLIEGIERNRIFNNRKLNFVFDIKDILLGNKIYKGHDLVHFHNLPPVKGDFAKTWMVHDSIILGGMNNYRNKFGKLWEIIAKRKIDQVDTIFTYSNSVLEELEKMDIDIKNFKVITPYVKRIEGAPIRPKKVKDKYGFEKIIDGDFVLIVGSLERRKRPDLSSKVIERMGLTPVLVGGKKDINLSEFSDKSLFIENCNDDNLTWLYRNSSGLISTSMYEGVNMPLIEQSYENKPVGYSGIDVHKELFGEKNILDGDIESMAKKMKIIIEENIILDVRKFSDKNHLSSELINTWGSII